MAGGARRTATVKPNNQRAPGPLGNATGLITPQTDPNPNGNSAPPIKPAPNEEGFWSDWGGAIHTALDVVGMIPIVGEVADGANALIYLAEGDAVNAALSAAAMLPVGGQAATGVKWGKKGVDAVQAAKPALKAEKEIVEQAAKQGGRKESAQEAAAAGGKRGGKKKGGKDKGKQRPHKDCGKVSKYSDAPKKLGELNADHVPSGAALKKAAERQLRELGVLDDLSPKQLKSVLNKVYNSAPTITIPEDVHKEGRTWGGKNKPLVQEDSLDLKGAFQKDAKSIQESMDTKDHGCSEKYKAAVKELSKFDFDRHVVDTIRAHKDVASLLK